jgi:hypothetical protein
MNLNIVGSKNDFIVRLGRNFMREDELRGKGFLFSSVSITTN